MQSSTKEPGVFTWIIRYLRRQTPALTVIAAVVVLAALKAAAPILPSFLLALFLIAVFQPLQRRLQRVMPNSIDQTILLATASPLAIVLSVVFWGWLWGVVGAFLAVPLTVVIIVTCRQFERTRWLATLLADWQEDEPDRSSA